MPCPIPNSRRVYAHVNGVELRDADPLPKITGYAAVFGVETEIYDYTEIIAPGAFADALESSDTRALYNHDRNLVLGRVSAKTLTLAEDAHGLRYTITPPDTPWVRGLIESIRRGDVRESSFGFDIAVDGSTWSQEPDRPPKRTITRVGTLYDVSPVAFAAYPETEVQLNARAALTDAYTRGILRPMTTPATTAAIDPTVIRARLDNALALAKLRA